jgi:uncharacterized repeat protein (TIGR04138 family)
LATLFWIVGGFAASFGLVCVFVPHTSTRIILACVLALFYLVVPLALTLAHREGKRFKEAVDSRRMQSLSENLGYPPEAIAFVLSAVSTEETEVRTSDVGRLVRRKAERTFGRDAKLTLKSWGILRSEDLGLIIDGLVRKQLLMKQEGDTWRDFESAFDIDDLFAVSSSRVSRE